MWDAGAAAKLGGVVRREGGGTPTRPSHPTSPPSTPSKALRGTRAIDDGVRHRALGPWGRRTQRRVWGGRKGCARLGGPARRPPPCGHSRACGVGAWLRASRRRANPHPRARVGAVGRLWWAGPVHGKGRPRTRSEEAREGWCWCTSQQHASTAPASLQSYFRRHSDLHHEVKRVDGNGRLTGGAGTVSPHLIPPGMRSLASTTKASQSGADVSVRW